MARRSKRRKRLVRRLVVGLVIVLVLGGGVGAVLWHPGGGRQRRIRRGTPIAALHYTCDLQGKLMPCTCEEGRLGGVARIAGLLDLWRADRADAIVVDVGNATAVGLKEAQTINRFTFEALGLLGYTVANCGENEVALPRDQLEAMAKTSKVHVVSASVIDSASGNTIFPPYHIEARGGVRVAFIGLVHHDIDPARIGKGLRLLAPEDALRAALASLADQADLVVALAYMPADQLHELARKYPKVNVFLGGKAGASSAPYELVRSTVVAYLGDQGCAIGRLEAAFPKDKLPDVQASIRLLDASAPEGDGTKDFLERFSKAVAFDKRPCADFDPKMPCTASFVAAEVCKLCHISEFYSWQATDHAGAYVTLLQNDQNKNRACLPCHVTGHAMPAGYAARDDELEQAHAATRKLELQRTLQSLGPAGGDPDTETRRKDVERQLAELAATDLGRFASLDGPALDKETQTIQRAVDALKNVGCECCHGGARRHVAVALKDRSAAASTPYQRHPVSARSCTRCHNPQRPCLPAEQADPFDPEAYLTEIKHWP